MSQKSASQVSHRPADLAQFADEIQSEMEESLGRILQKFDGYVRRDEVDPLLHTDFQKMSTDIKNLQETLAFYVEENKKLSSQLSEVTRNYVAEVEQHKQIPGIVNSNVILAEKIDAVKEAVTELASKLDAEDVADLDTDYEATVAGFLV